MKYAIKIYDYPAKGKSQWWSLPNEITSDLNALYKQKQEMESIHLNIIWSVEEYIERE